MYRPTEALHVSEFKLDNVDPGTKKRLQLLVDTLPDGQPLAFSTLILRGKTPGKTFLVTGGVHGDEYEGPIAIQDLFQELDPETLRGTYFAIPILNTPAFVAGTREGGWDHQNLARIFPGNPSGTLSERIANAFSEYVVGQADFYLDMHAAGNPYAIQRFAGYAVRAPEINDVQKAGAIAFGFDFVWGTTALPGRSLSAAGDKGVPAIYVEMPGEGRCRADDRALARQGVRNVMAYLEMVPGDFPRQTPRYCFETLGEEAGHLQIDHASPTSGLFVPSVDIWERVEKDQTLGEIRHPDGTVLGEVRSARTGRVLFMRTLPRVFAGDFLAYVLELPRGIS